MERRRVLIVDDNDDVATAMAEVLKLHGYDPTLAPDARTAVATAVENRPDVILLDIRMPGEAGYEVCRAVRAEPWGSSVLIIVVTGLTRLDDRVKARDAGCDHYLIKPVEFETLDRLMRGRDLRATRSAG
jgi:DNA-binding response OmpR family regulator